VILMLACQVYATPKGKVLSFFNVVKFPNDDCESANGMRTGTCYTAEECETRNGVNSGSCADGFGVCCVIVLNCATTTQTSRENNTFIASGTTIGESCVYSICPITSTISRIRLDFNTFNIAPPYIGDEDTANDGATGGGQCIQDTFQATGAPTICGLNTGQHMILDSDGIQCTNVVFSISPAQISREWDIRVQQFEKSSGFGGPAGCLQYFTASATSSATNVVQSFNWQTTNNVVNPANAIHLANQNYKICFRPAVGMCQLCLTPTIQGTLGDSTASPAVTAVITSFGLSISATTDVIDATVNSECATDYLVIPNAKNSDGSGVTVNRLCGRWFNGETTATAETASPGVCTTTMPFEIRFVSDAGEVNDGSDDPNLNELVGAADNLLNQGTAGFSLNYEQVAC